MNMVFVLFVEGPDDRRFARSLFVPSIQIAYMDVRIQEYACNKLSMTNEYVKNIKNIDKWDYLFLADLDDGTCVTKKKEQLIRQYTHLESERILIVKHEVESWYLAGVDSDTREEFRIQVPRETSNVTKEAFNRIIPKRFQSRIDFMAEILNRYDIEAARRKNESLEYAMHKHFDRL